MKNDSTESPPQWLLLIHQLPPKPDYFRVKVNRRLRKIGARLLKNSVYVLPRSDEGLEDFKWLAREIAADGGEATVCEASFLEGITDKEITAMFDHPGEPQATETDYTGRTWVTREGAKVDRMASAWLIRRFIDEKARFKFVPAKGYRQASGELRFDMYEGEFTHEGDACTFETLLTRFSLDDRALRHISEIVHDVDLKDEKFERPEAAGFALVIEGIARTYKDDAERLERSAPIFEDLFRQFRRA
ncbi:MAG TPA: chromate resistance protein ChrB domain-containing protein [Gemmatimonadales bacterium]|nr:chromate resistance protein ChrB domain-containing protein [Gemmatimonadales bacterium]